MPEQFWKMIPAEFVTYAEARFKAQAADEKATQHRTAVICCTIANFAPFRDKSSRHYKVEDFLPPEPMTEEQMLKQVEVLNAMFGGTDNRKKGGE